MFKLNVFNRNIQEKLPPIHPNCRCVAYFFKKEGAETNGVYQANLNSFKRIGNVDYDAPEVNPEKEFGEISKKGFIKYVDKEGNTHEVKVKCKESSIIKFEEDDEIGKKLDDEECYEYQILDDSKNLRVTIYKSKSHKQFSMSQLMSVYDNLSKTLINECYEIILSSQEVEDKSGGFVLESKSHRIHIMKGTNAFNMEPTLIHETAHTFDFSNGSISSSDDYIKLASKHPSSANPLNKNDPHYYAEDFAYSIEALFSDFPPINDKTIYLYKLLGIIK